MIFANMRTAALALILGGVPALPALATGGFDESSFEEGGAATQSPPNATGGDAGGGFGESSFEEGGGDQGAAATPQPGQTPGGGSTPGGFDDGSFEPGGQTPEPAAQPGGPVGGDDFPTDGRPQTQPAQPETDTPDPQVVEPEPALPQPPPNTVPTPTNRIDPQISAFETRDFGVPPQNSLRQGQFHAPTPTSLPGASLLTTANLVDAMNQQEFQIILIDVLGNNYSLPGAYMAPALAYGGAFNDAAQQQAAIWLRQITNGRADMPIIIFCSDPMCWLSYNASLRTVAAGYTNVYWYRGGLQAWQMAGLPLRPSGF